MPHKAQYASNNKNIPGGIKLRTDTIKSEIMLRIKQKSLIDKLQDLYDNSKCKSVNEFLNTILKVYAFKSDKQDEIIEKLETIEDTTNAIYEKVKR